MCIYYIGMCSTLRQSFKRNINYIMYLLFTDKIEKSAAVDIDA